MTLSKSASRYKIKGSRVIRTRECVADHICFGRSSIVSCECRTASSVDVGVEGQAVSELSIAKIVGCSTPDYSDPSGEKTTLREA